MIPLSKNNYIRRSGSGSSFNIEIDPLPSSFDSYFIDICGPQPTPTPTKTPSTPTPTPSQATPTPTKTLTATPTPTGTFVYLGVNTVYMKFNYY